MPTGTYLDGATLLPSDEVIRKLRTAQ